MNSAKLRFLGPWILIGVLVVILVASVFLLLMPKLSEYDTKLTDIRKAKDTLSRLLLPANPAEATVGRPDVARWDAFRTEAVKELSRLLKLYDENTTPFQSWFPDYSLTWAQAPPVGDFLTKWDTRKQKLDEDITPPDAESSGLSWEAISKEKVGALPTMQQHEVMKAIQKSFWVRQMIHDAIKPMVDSERKNGGKQISSIKQVAWLEPVNHRFGDIGPTQSGPATGMAVMQRDYPAVPFASEFEFPGKLGRSMTFGIKLEIRLSYLPNFLSALMSPKDSPKAMIELLGVRLFPTSANPREMEKPAEKGKEALARAEAEKDISAVPVEVRLSARILDFSKEELDKRAKELGIAR